MPGVARLRPPDVERLKRLAVALSKPPDVAPSKRLVVARWMPTDVVRMKKPPDVVRVKQPDATPARCGSWTAKRLRELRHLHRHHRRQSSGLRLHHRLRRLDRPTGFACLALTMREQSPNIPK
jgi:hypothetical protein